MDMYEYIGKCKLAKNDRLLQKTLKSRCSYFLIEENSVFYSVLDLVEIECLPTNIVVYIDWIYHLECGSIVVVLLTCFNIISMFIDLEILS